MTQHAKPLIFLTLMMLAVLVYSLNTSGLAPLLGLTSELDHYIVNKWLLVIVLLGAVVSTGLHRQSGLVAKVNWRTLPLYWPMALLIVLAWLGSENPPSAIDAAKILVFCIAIGISEELMFRGLVFHWFRALSSRSIVLVSATSFGAIHLAGLGAGMHPAVVFSQVYFAFALGLIFAGARVRDVSILLPIAVHALFDFLAISARGSVSQTFENVEQAAAGMLFVGSIAMVWGLVLLWRLKETNVPGDFRSASAEGVRETNA